MWHRVWNWEETGKGACEIWVMEAGAASSKGRFHPQKAKSKKAKSTPVRLEASVVENKM